MKFRKKPVLVDAVLFTGDNFEELGEFAGSNAQPAIHHGKTVLAIETLEGTMIASPGDWIVQGTWGEFYPCKPGPFEDTFEPVDESG
jgi:hypothetical protein